MRLLSVYVLGGFAFVVAAGHLFFDDTTSASSLKSPSSTERHIGLYKLIRSSEDAIRWISNKTTSSLNDLFQVKNETASPTSTELPPPQQMEKHRFLEWLKAAVKDPLAEDEYEDTTTATESGESIVFAHRTDDRGFVWGPPGQNTTAEATTGNASKSLMARVRSALSELYLGIQSLSDRFKALIQVGLTKVFAKKDPFLMRQYASQSIEKQLEDMEKNNGSIAGHNVMFACDDNMKPVCAVDTDGHYTIFQNECKMVSLNYKYSTNFSVHDKDVCMGLFARSPDLFYQTPTGQPPTKT